MYGSAKPQISKKKKVYVATLHLFILNFEQCFGYALVRSVHKKQQKR